MKREEARRLIGQYAAGSLTSEETQRLFEAALEDQDLFDELAQEDALKEILDQPGAKQRLIAALGAGKRAPVAWWKRRLVWSAAAAAMVGITVAAWSVLRVEKPIDVAQVSAPAATPAPPPVAIDEPKAVPAPAGAKRPKRVGKKPAGPPPTANDSEESSKQVVASPVGGFVPRAAPLSAPAARSAAAPMIPAAPPLPGLAFDYTVNGAMLDLRFLTGGFFSIQFTPAGVSVSDESLAAGTLRHQPIPDGATQAHITFTAAPDAPSGGVSLERDPPSGRARDPSGTRIDLKLRLR